MFFITKTIDRNLKKIKKIENGCWVNFSNPSKEELEKFSRDLKIPLDFLTDPLDTDERARVEREDGYTLIILRIPFFDKEKQDTPFFTIPLGIILSNDIIITVCSRESNIIDDFLTGKIKNFSTENKSNFLLQIFLKSALLYLNHLKEINNRTNIIEKDLHESMKNEELIKLLNLEKSLVFFTTSLKSNELMMERLQKTQIIKLAPDDKDLLDDVIIENKQAIEMSNIYSNILSGMMDAFASVISNNLNVVMKFLTSVTIIFMIPTLIASIYGMNVPLPLQHSHHAFLFTIVLSLVLSVIGVFIFMKRNWF